MYMRSPAEGEAVPVNLSFPVTITLVIAGVVTLLLGIWPTPLVNLTALGVFG